jgi:hypothetical protein
MDAIISNELDAFMCTASNTIDIRRHMDPLYDIKSAEWGRVYPASMVDINFSRWKDEG